VKKDPFSEFLSEFLKKEEEDDVSGLLNMIIDIEAKLFNFICIERVSLFTFFIERERKSAEDVVMFPDCLCLFNFSSTDLVD